MPLVSKRRSAWLVVAIAILTATFAVGHVSSAALTGMRSPAPWVDGEFALGDEPVTARLFDVDGMLPGQTEVRCVAVRYEGSGRPADVRVYVTDLGGGLARYLDVRVEVAPGCDAFPAVAVPYAGPLAEMPGTWLRAAEHWNPGRGDRRAYRFSVTLRDDRRAQGHEATASFVWEARPSPAGTADMRPHASGVGAAGVG